MEKLKQRFFNKVRKGELNNSCWEWVAAKRNGYGCIKVDGKTIDAHRLSYLLHYEDPKDLFVCHSCDNRVCVNPDHLFLSDHSGNMQDAANKGRLWHQQEHVKIKLRDERSKKYGKKLILKGITYNSIAECARSLGLRRTQVKRKYKKEIVYL